MSKVPRIDPDSLVGKLAAVACNIESPTIAGILATVLLVTVRTSYQQYSSLIIPADPVIASGCLVR